MKKHVVCILFLQLLFTSVIFCQTEKYRSGIFLHHSTGQNIWGPNGSNSSVPQEINSFNSAHGLIGDDAFKVEESWYPNGDNEWYTWDRIFQNDPSFDDIKSILENNKIIIIKSCFPSSNIYEWGFPADTLYPDSKTVANYKWHWRNIIKVMKNNPHNFFAIWTNAPLVQSATNETEAHLSDLFCKWAKDTLAAGLDGEIGKFPQNIYVFDFFHKLTDEKGFLQLKWAASEGDSHPNSAATELVAKPFVNEILGAALQYEEYMTSVADENKIPCSFNLEQNYPNPFNPTTTIKYTIPTLTQGERMTEGQVKVTLKIYDILGNEVATLINSVQSEGAYNYVFSIDSYKLSSGTYFYQLSAGNFTSTKKMLLLK